MRQYGEIKKQYPDALLFFRLGDFYELFMEDAEIGAEVLDITLTARPRGKDGKIPMAGVPYHAVDSYLAKLVKAGYKVAICEQIGEPNGKDIVERQVVRVVTPGTVMDEKALNRKQNNFLVSLNFDGSFLCIAATDVSTGHFEVKTKAVENLRVDISEELARLSPSECILSLKLYSDPEIIKILKNHRDLNIYEFKNWEIYSKQNDNYLKDHFKIKSLKAFDIIDKSIESKTCATLLGYLKETQKTDLKQIKKIVTKDQEEFVSLDKSTITNLELFSTIKERETYGSLLSILDSTKTAMGGRLLKSWLVYPLKDKLEINKRLAFVEEFTKNKSKLKEINEILKQINDLERIISRVASGLSNPRDLISLKVTLKNALKIKHLLLNFDSKLSQDIQKNISIKLQKLVTEIDQTIVDEPPVSVKDGGIIKSGFSVELDKIKNSISNDEDWVFSLEEKERKRTGINTLKVSFNKVFGYYIEISKANAKRAPHDYIRKQTLVNAERFITPELKEKEEIILASYEEINLLEYEIYNNLINNLVLEIETMQITSEKIATLDCIANFATIAIENNYIKPSILYSSEIRLKKSRHPVVEKLITESRFVPNDVSLSPSKHSLLLLTGPNMAGKSVLMRQVAVIVLMAQIGSFVPASSANIGIVDKIFVRSGASDVIASGISTFMLEMVETAYILNHTTNKSLIIMDEVGRGTSTFDGISIAWAIVEYLAKKNVKTLFATHYHELQELEEIYPTKIANYNMTTVFENKEPIFLYKFEKGATSHSFGVAVAKMAGIPKSVVKQSEKILEKLENKNTKQEHSEVKSILNKIDLDNTTPLKALRILEKIKKLS